MVFLAGMRLAVALVTIGHFFVERVFGLFWLKTYYGFLIGYLCMEAMRGWLGG